MSRKCFTAEHQIQCVAHQIGWSASSLVRPYFQHALELLGNGCLALFRQLADVQAGFQNFVVVKASHFAIGGVGKTPDLVGFFTHRVVSVCGLGCFALRFGFGKIGKQTNLIESVLRNDFGRCVVDRNRISANALMICKPSYKWIKGVNLFLGLQIRRTCIFFVPEISKNTLCVGNTNDGPPTSARFVKVDTRVSRCVVSMKPLVLRVLTPGRFSQIAQSVVMANAVDMVNFFIRPSAMNVKPRQAMGEVNDSIHYDFYVPLLGNALANTAWIRSCLVNDPSEYPCFSVVSQQLLQSFYLQVGAALHLSHRAFFGLVDLANVAFAKIKQFRAKFIIRAKYQPCAKLRNRRLSATANLCNLHLGNACALQF